MLSTVFEHDRVVSSTQKNSGAQDAFECSNVFLSARNNPGVLKNSTEHTEPLFITFRQYFASFLGVQGLFKIRGSVENRLKLVLFFAQVMSDISKQDCVHNKQNVPK